MIEIPEDHDELDVLSLSVMNTTFYFAVRNCKLKNWKEVMEGWVQYVEKDWSRFQISNELGRLNQLAVGETIPISPPLFDVLQRAEHYRQVTNGFFSPYLLAQLQFHGYETSFPFHNKTVVNEPQPKVYNHKRPPFQFDHSTNRVTRWDNGLIDLGGIGKGYAVEAASRWLRQVGQATAGIVDGGGDITVWSDGSKEWRIGIDHPLENDKEIAQIRLKNGSIATSNVLYRSWTQGDTNKHHILNGKTGIPAHNGNIQATVIAENCLDAEVGAKLCLMMEEKSLKEQLKILNPSCSFLLITHQGQLVANGNEVFNQ